MNILLWIITVLVFLAYFATGVLKLVQPKEKLALQFHWAEDFSQSNIYIIGWLEVLGAVGLVLPRLTRILPWLSTLAALGLILTMIGAALVHVRRKESIAPNVVLGVLTVIALYGTTA